MHLKQMLAIRPGVTAIVGSGGKSTLLLALGRELSESGRVILCTTTHIYPPEGVRCLVSPGREELAAALAETPLVCAGSLAENGKFQAPELPLAELAELADYVLAEADGSRRLPVKAHAAWEPVVPPEANQTILVLGLSGLGQPIRACVHRPELYAARLGAGLDDPVTPELAARYLKLEHLHTRVLLNQADTPERAAAGRALAALLGCPVCMGALEKGTMECLY